MHYFHIVIQPFHNTNSNFDLLWLDHVYFVLRISSRASRPRHSNRIIFTLCWCIAAGRSRAAFGKVINDSLRGGALGARFQAHVRERVTNIT